MKFGSVAGLVLLIVNCCSCRCGDQSQPVLRGAQAPAPASANSKPLQALASAQPIPTPSAQPTALGCRELPSPDGEKPVGPDGIDVVEMSANARSSPSRLIAAWARNPDSPGGDPHFLFESTSNDDAVQSFVIFAPGILDASRFRSSPNLGLTFYLMEGRFTGRRIDYYEWYRAQHGKDANRADFASELWPDLEKKWPEFCVVRWCYLPDPNAGRQFLPEDRTEMVKLYGQLMKDLRDSGAKICRQSRPSIDHPE